MDAVPLWDVVTAAILDNPNICTDCRNLSIRIETKSPDSEGQTLIEINGTLNSWVCMAGDLMAFEKQILSIARSNDSTKSCSQIDEMFQ